MPATAPGRTSRGRGRAQIQRCSEDTAANQDTKDTEDTEDRLEDPEVTMSLAVRGPTNKMNFQKVMLQ